MKIYIILFIFIISLHLCSASLLLNQSSISINKTVNQDQIIVLKLTNTEPFEFRNITLETNPYITMPVIDSLLSGSTATINAVVISNVNANAHLRIRGYYNQSIGHSIQTFIINVSTGIVSPCEKSIIKGDSINWTNQINDAIQMVHEGSVETTMGALSSYLKTFPDATLFEYYFNRYGFRFPSYNCKITVLPDIGMVNDPQLDAFMNLSVSVNYPPTTISLAIMQNNHSMDFYATEDGIMSVSNTGNETAHNIMLSGTWLTFSENNFDLTPGQTKGLIYTITPMVSETNQTGKTYENFMSISGNFPTVQTLLYVYINQANIDSNASFSDAKNLIDVICEKYPQLCNVEPEIVYRNIQNGSALATFNLSEEQWNNLMFIIFDEMENRKTTDAFVRETIDKIDAERAETKAYVTNMSQQIEIMKNENSNSQTGVYILLIVLGLIISSVVTFILIQHFRKQTLQEKIDKW